MQVLVRDNNVDQALKALKKKMQREGLFREMKLRGHYEKPSEKRAREKAEAVRRARKLARKKLQREGLLPMKPKTDARGGPGGPGAGGRSGGGGGWIWRRPARAALRRTDNNRIKKARAPNARAFVLASRRQFDWLKFDWPKFRARLFGVSARKNDFVVDNTWSAIDDMLDGGGLRLQVETVALDRDIRRRRRTVGIGLIGRPISRGSRCRPLGANRMAAIRRRDDHRRWQRRWRSGCDRARAAAPGRPQLEPALPPGCVGGCLNGNTSALVSRGRSPPAHERAVRPASRPRIDRRPAQPLDRGAGQFDGVLLFVDLRRLGAALASSFALHISGFNVGGLGVRTWHRRTWHRALSSTVPVVSVAALRLAGRRSRDDGGLRRLRPRIDVVRDDVGADDGGDQRRQHFQHEFG